MIKLINDKRSYVTYKEMIIYGVANGGQCMGNNMINSYISYFFVNVFNIDARIVSIMLFFEGIWDTINDPIMGSLIDKTRTRWGKLRPYLIGVPLPLAIATVMLFAGPLFVGNYGSTDIRKVLYMVISYVVWEFMYTIGDVPFWGMSASISPNADDRTMVITSARLISAVVGFVPNLVIPIILDLVSGGTISTSLKSVFFILSIITGFGGMGLFSLSGICIKERVIQSEEQPSIIESFKGMFKNRPLLILILKDILSALGGIGGVFSTYYLVDVLGSASVSLITNIPGYIVGFISFMILPTVKKIMNNKQIVISAKTLSMLTGVAKFFLCLGKKRYANIRFMIPIMMIESVLNNIFSGMNSVVPTEMIGETVDYAEWTTGQRTEGTSFSVLTFVGKFTNSMSRALGTFLIPYTGYKTSNTTAFVKQSEKTQLSIFALNSIVPALFGALGIIPMLFYDLVGKKKELMMHELSVIRSKKIQELNEAEKENETT